MPACPKLVKEVRELQKVNNSRLKVKDKLYARTRLAEIRNAIGGSDIDNKKFGKKCLDDLAARNGKLPDGEDADVHIATVAVKRAARKRLFAAMRGIFDDRKALIEQEAAIARALRENWARVEDTVDMINKTCTLQTPRVNQHDYKDDVAYLVQVEARRSVRGMHSEIDIPWNAERAERTADFAKRFG